MRLGAALACIAVAALTLLIGLYRNASAENAGHDNSHVVAATAPATTAGVS
jgi:hypothetical protein